MNTVVADEKQLFSFLGEPWDQEGLTSDHVGDICYGFVLGTSENRQVYWSVVTRVVCMGGACVFLIHFSSQENL